jgi:hypothetical protein
MPRGIQNTALSYWFCKMADKFDFKPAIQRIIARTKVRTQDWKSRVSRTSVSLAAWNASRQFG